MSCKLFRHLFGNRLYDMSLVIQIGNWCSANIAFFHYTPDKPQFVSSYITLIMHTASTLLWSCITRKPISVQGLYSLSGRTSDARSREVSKPRNSFLNFSNRSEIWQAHRQQCCQAVRHISKRYEHCNIRYRGFVTSRDLSVRRPSA